MTARRGPDPKVQLMQSSDAAASERYGAPTCEADVPVESRLVRPAGASLWLVSSTLPAGARLEWGPTHGDEVLFVSEGALVVEGRACAARGAVVIEAGAVASVSAEETTRVLHMGPRDPAPPTEGLHGPAETEGHGVHVVDPRGTFEQVEPGRETRFFADSTCKTCRLWLLYTARAHAYESPVHSHSQDELIHVLEGEVALGSLHAGPGATLFIAADQLYHFRSGESGLAFINYRRDASQMRFQGKDELLVENGRSTGMHAVGP